jgi:hypothetical protein
MSNSKKYVVSKNTDKQGKEFYYCHLENYPYIPVFGSIGNKKKANDICKLMNGKN